MLLRNQRELVNTTSMDDITASATKNNAQVVNEAGGTERAITEVEDYIVVGSLINVVEGGSTGDGEPMSVPSTEDGLNSWSPDGDEAAPTASNISSRIQVRWNNVFVDRFKSAIMSGIIAETRYRREKIYWPSYVGFPVMEDMHSFTCMSCMHPWSFFC